MILMQTQQRQFHGIVGRKIQTPLSCKKEMGNHQCSRPNAAAPVLVNATLLW
jgi:hypothetical protein